MRSDNAELSTRSERNKRKVSAYAIFVLVLVVLIAAVLIAAWFSLKSFDKHTSQTLMAEIVDELSAEKGADVSFKRTVSKLENGLSYKVFVGDEEYEQVNLKMLDKAGFLGLAMYEVDDVFGVKSVDFFARENSSVTVDGRKLSNMKVSGEAVVLPDLQRLSKHPTNTTVKCTEYNHYYLDGLFEEPQIECGANEMLLEIGGSIYVAEKADEKSKAEISEMLSTFCKYYSYYMTADASFAKIRDDILYTSPIFNMLYTQETYWYTPHTSVNYSDFTAYDFVRYDDGIVGCDVEYTYTIIGQGKHLVNKPHFRFYLYNNGEKWQIIEMNMK